MTNTATLPAPAATAEHRLTIADRCDACGPASQAFVEVTIPAALEGGRDGTLLLCGHHYAEHESLLASRGYLVHDERERINAKPSVSANAD